jgi:hypothetical protein
MNNELQSIWKEVALGSYLNSGCPEYEKSANHSAAILSVPNETLKIILVLQTTKLNLTY